MSRRSDNHDEAKVWRDGRLNTGPFLLIALSLALVGCGGSDGATPATAETVAGTAPMTPVNNTADRPTTTAGPQQVSVELVGEVETVYDWSEDHCPEEIGQDVADLPVRAFRDADGNVQMNLSFVTNRRLIGPDLDAVVIDCDEFTLVSDWSPIPADYSFSEWIGSTYTLDGETIYALVHNEFHGEQASGWDGDRDFGATQGEADWLYQSWNGAGYMDMSYDTAFQRWQGAIPLCQVGQQWMHPDGACEPARTWESSLTGTVAVSGVAADLDSGGGDGVIASIFLGSEELWSATIENGDEAGQAFELKVDVVEGDLIHFRVNQRGDHNHDTTFFAPVIDVGEPPCPSGNPSLCTHMSITYARSTDGGRTFTQPEVPDHLVAVVPQAYEPDWGMVAMWQPSNIVSKGDFFYALVQLDVIRVDGPTPFQGTCLMRSDDLDDPKSWRVWDGVGFTRPFADPHRDSDTNPEPCQAVSWPEIGGMAYSLTYNTYLERFVLVGHDVNTEIPGFYFSTSEDLINWTQRQLLMPADLVQKTPAPDPYVAYPSLIDPDDGSLNFERPGRTPWLYYSVFNVRYPLETDLVRVRIRFDKC